MQSVDQIKWEEAINKELASLSETGTYDEVDELPTMKIINSKLVFKRKRQPDGRIKVFRVRLVALGYQQKEGIDFWETFSPTVSISATSIRIFLTVCASKNMMVHQVDVTIAFLHGSIDGTVYV